MLDPLARMREEKIAYRFCGYSSLDRYFRVKEKGSLYISTDSSVISLAKAFDHLQFPGFPLEDVSIDTEDHRVVFRCVDHFDRPPENPYTVLALLYDPQRDVFRDPLGIRADLRSETLSYIPDSQPPWVPLCEAAKLVSRYHYTTKGLDFRWDPRIQVPPVSYQKDLLTALLTARYPEKGLAFLHDTGFLEHLWPELAIMTRIPHVKDYHPEGNVWEHTLETLRYRKTLDLTLSLGLLLHDIGKPEADPVGERRFDRHSELGVGVAARYLRSLGFDARLVEDVVFLVRYHMMPAALPRLPEFRTEKVMESPLFPLLLELYRADLSSSFAAEEGYYEACRVYRSFLKDRKNPYREIREKRRDMAVRYRK